MTMTESKTTISPMPVAVIEDGAEEAAFREYEAKCAEAYRNWDENVKALVAQFGTVEYFDGYDYKKARAR